MTRALTLMLVLLMPAVHAAAQESPSGGPPPESVQAQAQPTPTPTPPKPQARPTQPATETPPMRFEWVREGPAEACGDKCREWIAAIGRITAETPRDFEIFVRGRDLRGATLVLDSSGGALSGLALGRAIRRLDITTTVGKTLLLPATEDGEKRATLSPKASCASMCAFVLLGGTRRHVPAEARVLVHQIWPSGKRDDSTAANYSALDLVRVQRELGNMARYTLDMGADIELFEIAMRIPPWEALKPLSVSDLLRLGIHNSENPFTPTPAGRPAASAGSAVLAAASPSALVTANSPAGPAAAEPARVEPAAATPLPIVATPNERPVSSTQQWSFTERSGTREIVRRNPLTIEGDEIGLFELRLSCGSSPDSYSISYAERRKPRESEAAGDRVNAVVVVLGRERMTLTVVASARNLAGEVTSVARGRVSAGVLNEFVEGKVKSAAIATRTGGNTRTLIRVGNTGLAQAFPQIAADCPK
jgi:hypothetical protein